MSPRRTQGVTRRGARRTPLRRQARSHAGFMLVEALIAILIFSVGILGVIGMQARSVQMMTEATFRAQAAQHASELISEMWTVDPSRLAALYASASTNPLRYNQWKARIESGASALPGALANPAVVQVTTQQVSYSASLAAGAQTVSAVVVTVFWQTPGASAPSAYTTTAMIMEPQS